jgi:hypothetical protein
MKNKKSKSKTVCSVCLQPVHATSSELSGVHNVCAMKKEARK